MDAVCRDVETAPVPDRLKALFRYLSKVNDAPATVGEADVRAAHAAGLSDEEIYDAVTVCAAFNYFNRWIDGTGVPDVPRGLYESRLEAQGDMGYAM